MPIPPVISAAAPPMRVPHTAVPLELYFTKKLSLPPVNGIVPYLVRPIVPPPDGADV